MFAKCQMVYHHGNCLNTKKAFAQLCRICVDVCPHQAISEYHEIESKKCTECGLCMAACPSNGFVDRMSDKLQQILESDKEEIILNCPQAQPAGLEIPCLGILDRDVWSTLILLSGRKSVKLFTGDCANCPDKQACAAAVKVFKELHADWPEHPELKILVKPDTGGESEAKAEDEPKDDRKPEKKKDKKKVDDQQIQAIREGFGLTDLRKKGIKAMESLLTEPYEGRESYPIPLSRQWLLRELQNHPQAKIPFRALTITQQCTGCGVCAKICPQGALELREQNNRHQIVYEPLKCVHCDRCLNSCQVQAMAFTRKRMDAKLLSGKVLIYEGNLRVCSQCGRQVFDTSEPPLCLICASSNHD